MRSTVSRPRFAAAVCAALLLIVTGLAAPAAAQDENLMFTSREDVERELVARINAENVRLDIAVWYLTQRTVSNAIINRHKAGVKVRVIGDRVSIFENDPNTTREFEHMATNGVPIRVRYNPTWFPEIIHWKASIFVGQNLLEFGSANYTVFELEPFYNSQNVLVTYNDENVLFTKDQTLLNAFKAQFDKYWADTTYFKDFNEAYRLERGTDFPVQLAIDRTPLEQDKWNDPLPPEMVWSQGSAFNSRLVSEINREVNAVDITVFRLSNSGITDALINKHRAGVPVRVLIEPNEYNRDTFPEYELTRARIDALWMAGVPVKRRVHQGLLHMKTLITSNVASIASSNFTNNWQRDHNYFLPAATKPALHQEMKAEFNRMWNDPSAYGTFQPAGPRAATLQTPANGGTGVSTTPQFVWKRATWAVAYKVLLGTSTSNMTEVATIPAVLTESPPATYSWTPSTPLQGGTTHVWRVVSLTNAGLTANSQTWSFTTTGSGGGGGGGGTQSPFTGSPVSLPGTVQAENFDNGGSGVAYIDLSGGNSGGAYRTTDVDVEGTSDSGGGHNVGWMSAGEWLEYTVNVASAGTYTLEARVAASGAGGTFHVEFNGSNKTGAMTIPNTGGWQNWTTISKPVTLSAGTQVMRIALDANGPGGVFGNLNWVKVVAASTPEDPPPPPPPPPGSTPFTGTPVALPGTMQAENFDNGGQNVAYHDKSSGNSGGAYRSTDVDIEGTADTGGGFDLGWMSAGEWLQYTVNVASAGTYTLELRVASPTGGGTFHVEFGGTNKTGTMTMPTTGGWQSWTTVSKTVTLSAGTQVMRFVVDTTASNGTFGNLNWLRVVSGGSQPPPPPPPPSGSTPFTGTPVPLPGLVQVENFDNGGADVAYHDNGAGNKGGAYRNTDVDIEATADTGGGFDIGWTSAGEWLNYTVNVPTAGTYTLQVRVASPVAGATFHVEFDGVDRTGAMVIPNTGGWQTWTTLSTTVNLSAGTQIMRVVLDSNAPGGGFGNMNWIRVQ